SEKIETTPPHDQLDQPYKEFLIKPKNPKDEKAVFTADYLNQLIEKSHSILISHEVNKKRLNEGKLRATHIWPWSGGKKPLIQSFHEKYSLSGSVISAVDLIFGLGIAAGLEPIHVEGATGLPTTNYQGKVDAALNELQKKDFVFLHIEAIDEMGHTGDPFKKISALEDFDLKVVKPFIQAESLFNNELVIAVLPDHPTPIKIRTHTNEPVPFVIYNPQKPINKDRFFSEKEAENGELDLVTQGEDFIKLFLNK
ncbi:MAG: phosphoglycerate mutase, partial [Promethearchaeota archaeon]